MRPVSISPDSAARPPAIDKHGPDVAVDRDAGGACRLGIAADRVERAAEAVIAENDRCQRA